MNEPMNQRKKCIILIGSMGCGKSTVGLQLHKETNLPLIDIDHYIEEQEQLSIPDIFEQKGEEYFRDLETGVLKTLLAQKTPEGYIVSTGGGIVKREENRKLLKKLGYIVWLDIPAEIAFERICKNKDRPLLQTSDPLSTLVKISEERKPLYNDIADLVIETAPLNSQEVAFGIVESARHFFTY